MRTLGSYDHLWRSFTQQFGLKPGCSTTHCTGLVKSVVSHTLIRGFQVFGCFPDASKLVDHQILFQSICSNFATAHKLEFNTSKTQLICFRKPRHCSFPVLIGHLLQPSDKVIHLGHILSYNLRDTDILRSCKDLNRLYSSRLLILL